MTLCSRLQHDRSAAGDDLEITGKSHMPRDGPCCCMEQQAGRMDGPRTRALGALVALARCEKTGRARGACWRPAAALPAEPCGCPAPLMGTWCAGMAGEDRGAVEGLGGPAGVPC